MERGGGVDEGLLSYALVHEGLELEQADFQPKDGKILMEECRKGRSCSRNGMRRA